MNVLVYSSHFSAIEGFVAKLQSFIKDNYEDIGVESVQDPNTFTEKISIKYYDIVYYDISGRNSKEEVLAELQSFRLLSPECDILLIAENEVFSLIGYRVHAYDYVVFSEETDELILSFMRIMREKYDQGNIVYSVRMKGVWRRLKLQDIIYMETNDHHVVFHMNNGQVYKKLANFNNLTPPIGGVKDLFQCHKSYVVNGRYIENMTQNVFIMRNGKRISISKPNRKNARNFFSWCVINGYIELVEKT